MRGPQVPGVYKSIIFVETIDNIPVGYIICVETFAGNNRPTLKLLNKLVKKSLITKWYDLGIELLAEEDVQALDEIQRNNPRDASTCCTKMFQLWLERQPKASWKQLVEALKEPNIEMNELANTIEQKLVSINKGTTICCIVWSISTYTQS